MKKKTSFLIPLMAWPTLACADLPTANEGILTLVDEPGYNKIQVTVASGIFSISDISTFTGEMRARLDIDPSTGRSPKFTLLFDGNLQDQNIEPEVVGTPVSIYLGIPFVGSIDIKTTDVFGTVWTHNPPGLINPSTGKGDATQQAFRIHRGKITGQVLGQPYLYDYAQAPNTGYGINQQTVTITPTGTDSTRGYFDVTLILPIGFTEEIPNNFGVRVTLSDSGTFKAKGQVSVPLSDYLAWTELQGTPGVSATTHSQWGVDNGVLWALGLDINQNPSPYLPVTDSANPRGFSFTLPTSGTTAPLYIESSTSLKPGSWTLLSLPTNPLPAGTSGKITIPPSDLPSLFLRIRSEP